MAAAPSESTSTPYHIVPDRRDEETPPLRSCTERVKKVATSGLTYLWITSCVVVGSTPLEERSRFHGIVVLMNAVGLSVYGFFKILKAVDNEN